MWKFFLLGMAAAVATGTAQAGKKIADSELDVPTGTRIEITSVFDPLPPSGYAPIRVIGTNGSGKDTRWTLSIESGRHNYNLRNRYSSEFGLEIGSRSTAARTLLVPVPARYGGASGSVANDELSIHLDAGAFGGRDFSTTDQLVGNLPSIAISKVLQASSGSALNSELESQRKSASMSRVGGGAFGSEFNPDELPEDWRGFSGFDVMMITHAEWLALKPGQRLAIMQWIRLGGRLHFYMPPDADAAALGIEGKFLDGTRALSQGQVALFSWDGQHLNAVETVRRYWGGKEREKELIESYSAASGGSPQWGLLRTLGVRSFASWQVLVFLVVFGILVGPVNLFLLAPPSRRHRMFVTTPLLSLGASVLMIGILLIQDGIGGRGRRFIAVNLESGDAAAYVTQEQVSRTGFLISSGFELKQAALVEPLALPDTPWVKLKNEYTSQGVVIQQNGAAHSGNVFQSRAEQGQLLHAVVSARSRLEMKSKEGETPEMVSALGFTAAEVYYVDDSGKVWRCVSPAGTGQVLKFAPSDLTALKQWWKQACANAGERTRERLEEQVKGARDMFFATANLAPEFTLDTLKSIRWEDDQVVIFGSVPKL